MSRRLVERRQQLANSFDQHDLTLEATEAEMDFFHELAEALTVIHGQVHLAQKSLSSHTVSQEYLEAIQHTVMRIGQRMQGDLPAS